MSLTIKTIDGIRRKLTFGVINRAKTYGKLIVEATCERTGDDEIRDHIRNKWQPIGTNKELYYRTCANLRDQFYLSDDNNKGILIEKEEKNNWDNYDKVFTNCISSPMLLYRCCCTFPENIQIEDQGKSVWSCWLIHKSTENGLLLSEHKGSPTLGLDFKFRTVNDLPVEFSEDIVELMNYLLSDQCTHPYDNVVAGSEA